METIMSDYPESKEKKELTEEDAELAKRVEDSTKTIMDFCHNHGVQAPIAIRVDHNLDRTFVFSNYGQLESFLKHFDNLRIYFLYQVGHGSHSNLLIENHHYLLTLSDALKKIVASEPKGTEPERSIQTPKRS